MSRHLNIVLLIDLPGKSPGILPMSKMTGVEYKDERHVIRALMRMGHKVTTFAVYDNLHEFMNLLTGNRPDLVFSMCESYRNNRDLEPQIVGLLELLNIPYTGGNSSSLLVTKDKAQSKKILAFHNLPVPDFHVVQPGSSAAGLKDIRFPAIVKPLDLDASEGLTKSSVVTSAKALQEQIKRIHKTFDTSAIVEEFIEGREIYIGVIGSKEPIAFFPQELFFKGKQNSSKHFLTFKAKWDLTYRKKWGIDSGKAKNISEAQIKSLKSIAVDAFKALKLTGYARIDFRISDPFKPYIIEINSNPSIAKNDDFAASARCDGWKYDEIIDEIINIGIETNRTAA